MMFQGLTQWVQRLNGTRQERQHEVNRFLYQQSDEEILDFLMVPSSSSPRRPAA